MPDETFDYIVIGSGSAGGVVAARLTEDPEVRVLLLEAGPADDDDNIHIPLAFSALFKTRWDWNYETTPQKHLGGRRAYWPRMKALGGCSSMNAMIYIRGNHADYDEWRDAYGATGWGFDDVLPYFRKAERNTRLGGRFHGTDGPLHVEDRTYDHELSTAFVEAGVVAGLKRNDDFNGAEQEGVGLYQVTCRKGRRWSVADAYIHPADTRPNLTVRTEAFVTRIVLEGNRAVGVAYTRRGEHLVARADAEVVLSGGAVNSPQLLMLSGIGPGAHLRDMGIDVAVESSGVGQNLQDHPAAGILSYTRDTTDIAEMLGLGNLAEVEGDRQGSAELQRRGGRCVLRLARRPRAARHPAARRADRLLRQRHARARTSRADHGHHAGQRAELGPRQAAIGRPDLAPRDRSGLLRRPRRPRGDDRWLPHRAGDPAPGPHREVRRRAVGPGVDRPERRRDHRGHRPARARRSTTPSRPARWARSKAASSTPS